MWYLDFEYVICLEGQMKICLLVHENFVKLKLTTEDQKSFFLVIDSSSLMFSINTRLTFYIIHQIFM